MALAVILAVAIVLKTVFVIVGDFELAQGKPTWGDIFVFLSIVAAGAIAGFGWFLTNQHNGKERKRIALAECVIFYHKYSHMRSRTLTFLALAFVENDKIIAKLNKCDGETDDDMLLKHFAETQSLMRRILLKFPETIGAHEQLSKVYQYSDDLGKILSKTVNSLDLVRESLENYTDMSSEAHLNNFKTHRHGSIQFYYKSLSSIVMVPINFEKIRDTISIGSYTPSIRVEVLEELRRRFEDEFNIDFIDGDLGTSSEAFVDLITQIEEKFTKIWSRSQNYVIGKFIAENDGKGGQN